MVMDKGGGGRRGSRTSSAIGVQSLRMKYGLFLSWFWLFLLESSYRSKVRWSLAVSLDRRLDVEPKFPRTSRNAASILLVWVGVCCLMNFLCLTLLPSGPL